LDMKFDPEFEVWCSFCIIIHWSGWCLLISQSAVYSCFRWYADHEFKYQLGRLFKRLDLFTIWFSISSCGSDMLCSTRSLGVILINEIKRDNRSEDIHKSNDNIKIIICTIISKHTVPNRSYV
jgi:hypothetical protein